ncbi:MAG TPA: matrixin family metalloprotease, partial [Nitrososphaera sp.]
QKWRQALREYTDNHDVWSFTARYVNSEAGMESCDVKFYIYDTYKDFPDYPDQTGAYTSVKFREGSGDLDARVYLAPLVLHGDGETEIDLPGYAFRNSAVHEVGHVLGLGHMQSLKGYLMSPQFDFWEQDDQLPITTLELEMLVDKYGNDGFN